MADLSNLFDSPPAPPPARSPRAVTPDSPSAGPSRIRNNDALFLSPGSVLDSPVQKRTNGNYQPKDFRDKTSKDNHKNARNPLDVDMDMGMDLGFDFDDNDFDINDLPAIPPPLPDRPSNNDDLNSNGMKRPNGDFEHMLDPFAGLNRNNGGDRDGNEGDGISKRKREVAKVDADRLTGEDGILKLMKASKKFKVKGKGREVS